MESNYSQLLEIIKQQSEIIKKQVKFIDKLVNDNAEKENMISVLLLETTNKSE